MVMRLIFGKRCNEPYTQRAVDTFELPEVRAFDYRTLTDVDGTVTFSGGPAQAAGTKRTIPLRAVTFLEA